MAIAAAVAAGQGFDGDISNDLTNYYAGARERRGVCLRLFSCMRLRRSHVCTRASV
jgi:hypothetical protein